MSLRQPFLVVLASLLALAAAAAPAGAQAQRQARITFETGDFDTARKDWPITRVNVSGDLDRGEAFAVELRDRTGRVLWSGSASYQPPTTSIDVETFVAVGDVEEAAIAQRRPGGGTAPPPSTPTDPPDPTDPTDPPDPTDPTDPPDPTDPTGPTEPTGPNDPSGPSGPDGPGTTDGPAVGGDVTIRRGTPPGDDVDAVDGADEDGDADPAEVAAGATPPGGSPSVGGDVVTRPDHLPQQGNGASGAGQLALSMVIAVVFVAILFRTPLPSATTVRWRK